MEWALVFIATLSFGSVESPTAANLEVEAPTSYQRTESTEEAFGVLSECWGATDWRECPAVKAREL